MRRVIAIAIAGASLAGCSSFSLDSFKSAPPLVKVALESAPPGADATTSLGPGCKTPCSIDVPAPDAGFSVTFAMPKFQPVTVPVQVIHNPGDFSSPATTIIEPSPVFAELQPAAPPEGQADASEEAEATQGGRGAGPRATRHALIPLRPCCGL